MGTRALVNIEGFNVATLYVHYDGYPENMLPILEPFAADFIKQRGVDPSYMFAQLLRHTHRVDPCEDDGKYLGYGVIAHAGAVGDHGQDYTYTLKSDGTVTYKKNY
jgi:hypothetical protein